jgi:replicative DNA helicase|tara:strand:- start:5034 stop:6392 length:1359 start_codon:yes stop_codon:yes gene_type:complete
MESKEKVTFSRYGKSFQEQLCMVILDDRPFADQVEEVLDISFLELRYLKLFVKVIFEYRQKYGLHPSRQILGTILRSGIDDENELTQRQVREYYARVMSASLENQEYIKDTALDFCRKQNLKSAMIKSIGLLQNSSFDEIAMVINESLKLGADNNAGYDWKKDFEERFKPKFRNPVTTGWPLIDEICQGGLGQKELGVVIAPTGAGKSMALVHLGTEALKEGKTVIHYTLELQDTVVGSRYDSCLTRIGLGDLITFKEKIYEEVQGIEGQLIIKEYPTKSASTHTLKTHLERLRMKDVSIDMVIVDYADLLRPVTAQREKRNELESIYEELRGLAQEYKCPVWTASQTNRSGLNAEVITMESISEAFNKCFVSDFIFSISRTVDDKQANTGRVFIAKNRNGPDGIIYPLFMDTSTVSIKVLEPSEDDEIEVSPTVQKQKLAEKYKKFKDGSR